MRQLIFLCVLFFCLTHPAIIAGQSDMVVDLATRINRERTANNLTPYALNAQLTKSAQAHADDIARTLQYGHIGSDGSTAQQRVERAGYGKYSWGFRVGENWAHYASVANAFAMWMDSTPHRNNILHAYYREIGIGIARSQIGLSVFVVDFGAQPNTLPFFINDGTAETRTTQVTLTLGDELVAPAGDGDNRIGHPVQVQISNNADFAASRLQPYAPRIDWVLPPENGTKTVFIRYRDARGRTATASQSITLRIPATPTLARTATFTPRPTQVFTATPAPTETPTATATPAPVSTATTTPTLVPTATTTPTPLPTATPIIVETAGNDVATKTIVSVLGISAIIGGAFIVSQRTKDPE